MIDDEEANNFYHQLVIEAVVEDAEIVALTSGVDALEYLKNNPHNLPDNGSIQSAIFLDINMPGMSGWEFLDEYKKLENQFKVDHLIALVTSSQNPEDKKRAKQYDIVNEYIVKPLTEQNLRNILKDCK